MDEPTLTILISFGALIAAVLGVATSAFFSSRNLNKRHQDEVVRTAVEMQRMSGLLETLTNTVRKVETTVDSIYKKLDDHSVRITALEKDVSDHSRRIVKIEQHLE